MTRKIGLVAAARRQRGVLCRACEQFAPSPTFRRARAYCERHYSEWYVLTACDGLVAPQRVLGPGEHTLHTLGPQERAAWSARAATLLRERSARSGEPLVFVLYASQRWAEALQRAAPELALELPLAGMGLRERLRWYDERLRVRSRVLARPPGDA
jgi:hypothetical protein